MSLVENKLKEEIVRRTASMGNKKHLPMMGVGPVYVAVIIVDFLLLTRTHFYQQYYPEADVCDSCHKYGFNLKSQIIRIIGYPFLCALAAWICTLFS